MKPLEIICNTFRLDPTYIFFSYGNELKVDFVTQIMNFKDKDRFYNDLRKESQERTASLSIIASTSESLCLKDFIFEVNLTKF